MKPYHPSVNRPAIVALTLGWMVTFSCDAPAGFIYSLRFDQTQYFVAPGGTVNVSLILREEVTDGDTNRITGTNGVTAGNVRVNWDSGGSFVNAVGDAAYGAEFTGASKSLTSSNITLGQLAPSGAVGTQVSANIREVSMGTLTFSVPLTLGQTHISYSDANTTPVTFDDLVIGSGGGAVVIDSIVMYGSAAISNPEPSSFLVAAMGLIGSAVVLRRRGGRAQSRLRFFSRSV